MVKENLSYLLYPVNLKILRADPCQGILRLVIPFQIKCLFHLIEWFYFPFIDQFFPLKISYMMVIPLSNQSICPEFPRSEAWVNVCPSWVCGIWGLWCGVCISVCLFFSPSSHQLWRLATYSQCMVLAPSAAPNGKVLCCLFLLLKNQALSLLSLNTASQLVCKYKLWFQT